MVGSSLSCLVPLTVFSPITTWDTTLPYPPPALSVSSGVSSVTSPSYTSLFSLMRRPMARRKFSIKISVFFTSLEYTSEPTIGQKGTFVPSSCAIPSASAVLPVPGAPAMSSARPAIFFCLIMSTTTPHASRACSCPTQPALSSIASPSSFSPSPCRSFTQTGKWRVGWSVYGPRKALGAIARRAIGRADPAFSEKHLGKSNVGARLTGAIVARDRSPTRANASPTYLDVRMRCHALLLRRRLHFLDLHRGRQPGGVARSAAYDDPARRKRRVEETRSIARVCEAPVSKLPQKLTDEIQDLRLQACQPSLFPSLGCFLSLTEAPS